MSIEDAILGFLSDEPLTGYDLKKRFADSDLLHWSGNSNQIYTALVELRQAGLVAQTVEQPPRGPARKVYALTEAGRIALHEWLVATPDLPTLRHPLLVRLLWADQLPRAEQADLLARYEEELRVRLLMRREQSRRQPADPAPHPLREAARRRWLAVFEEELAWVSDLRAQLAAQGGS